MKKYKAMKCIGVRTRILDLGKETADNQNEGYRWVLAVEHAPPSTQDVVIAWYRTRKDARIHARKIRKALKV